MYSAYKLNKQGDSIQSWHTPFLIWNQSVVPCPVLTVASWPAYRFLKRQVRWSGISICFKIFQFVVIHTVKGFGIVNKTEIYVFLKLSYIYNMYKYLDYKSKITQLKWRPEAKPNDKTQSINNSTISHWTWGLVLVAIYIDIYIFWWVAHERSKWQSPLVAVNYSSK